MNHGRMSCVNVVFAIAVRQSRKDLMNYSSMGCVNGFEYCFAIAAGQSQKDLMI